jgi:hypothetical protein
MPGFFLHAHPTAWSPPGEPAVGEIFLKHKAHS